MKESKEYKNRRDLHAWGAGGGSAHRRKFDPNGSTSEAQRLDLMGAESQVCRVNCFLKKMDTKYDLENVVQNKFWSIFMITDIQSTCLLIQIDVFAQQTLRDRHCGSNL